MKTCMKIAAFLAVVCLGACSPIFAPGPVARRGCLSCSAPHWAGPDARSP